MSVVIVPSGQKHRPSSVFKVKVGNTPLPGFAQVLDDPASAKVTQLEPPGADEAFIRSDGVSPRNVTLSMRVLSRLTNATGMMHLNDCLDQYREALKILTRTDQPYQLYLGDSDRFLEATVASWSAPLAAPDHKAVTYNVSFATQPWYRMNSVSRSRSRLRPNRQTGTSFGAVLTNGGRYLTEEGLQYDTNNEFTTFPTAGNINLSEGTICFWAAPVFPNTETGQTRTFWRMVGSPNANIAWRSTGAFAARVDGTVYSEVDFVPPNPFIFGAGDIWVFIAVTWNSSLTRIYVGASYQGVLHQGVTGTSGNFMTAMGSVVEFEIGGFRNFETSNSKFSNLLIFDTDLNFDEIEHIFLGSEAYDAMDDSVRPNLVFDNRLKEYNPLGNPQGDYIYLDLLDNRVSYPVIDITPVGVTQMSASFAANDKSFIYNGPVYPPITIDTGKLTALRDDGLSVVKYISTPDFGFRFEGEGRHAVKVIPTTGTTNLSMTVTPRVER